ncbi:MAG TPA: Ig-like domain-containing protein [Solirubrobacter sp.]
MRWKWMTIGVAAACLAFAPAAHAQADPVVITAGPNGPTNNASPTFEFTAGFPTDCRLVTPTEPNPAFAPCTSPLAFTTLPDGAYQLTVAPSDTHDPLLSATRPFIVDTVAPTVEITSSPASPTRLTSIPVAFTSPDQGATFECTHTAPGGSPETAACTSPWTTNVTVDGDHSFSVVAIDAAGNRSAPAAKTIRVDTAPPAAPAITSPGENAVLGSSFALAGTVTDDVTAVRVSDNDVDRGPATLAPDGTWQLSLADLADGPHVLKVIATDAAGNTSTPAARTVRVDTVAPTVAITSRPPSPTTATSATIAFTASEDATFSCAVTVPHQAASPQPCTSPFTLPTPDEGAYRIDVTATDAAGLSSAPVTVTVTVDRTAPAAVVPSPAEPGRFTFAPAESGSTFQCRLEGPSGDSGFGACTSPKAYPDLPPGDYRFTLRTFDAAGNHSDAPPAAFSIVAAPIVAIPEPAPTPVAVEVAPPAPTPQAGATVVVRASAGTILVRRPGTTEFAAISRSTAIPLGSEVDARKGRVVLTAEPAEGKPFARATFYAGLFVVGQAGGYVELTLSEALAPCKKKAPAAGKPKSRKLWGDGKGKFRIKGVAGSATTGSGTWLVEDSCDGTLTRASQGVVSVRDTARRRTVLLRAGRSYLAKPK